MKLCIHRKDLRVSDLPALDYIAASGEAGMNALVLDPLASEQAASQAQRGRQIKEASLDRGASFTALPDRALVALRDFHTWTGRQGLQGIYAFLTPKMAAARPLRVRLLDPRARSRRDRGSAPIQSRRHHRL